MKKLILAALLSVGVVLTGCSKDEKQDLNLTTGFLNQTAWKGTRTTYNETGQTVTDDVSIMFTSENAGSYEVIYQNATPGNPDFGDYFDYTVNGKQLKLNTIIRPSPLNGMWWVLEKSGKKLKLGQNIESDRNKEILDLKRIY